MKFEPIKRYAVVMLGLVPFAATGQPGHAAADRAKYIPAKAIDKRAPRYPELDAVSRKEGWVVLSYIVSTSGDVKDIMIENSTGNEDFERAAVQAARTWHYKPAVLNGKPVEQSMTRMRMTFVMVTSPKRARRKFVSSFTRTQKAIRAGKLNEAQKILDGPELFDRQNLYEDAWFWWLKYEYLAAAGRSTPDQLMDCLHKAIGYQERHVHEPKWANRNFSYLPAGVFVAAATRLFLLQAQTLDLSGAMRTFDRLSSFVATRKARTYSGAIKRLEPTYAKIKSLISSDRILQMNARVGKYNDWVHQLVRRSFSLAKIKGHLTALEVRCKRGTEIFSATDGKTFTIPESWGDCSVYVKGDEGATFALYQYPKKSG